MSRGSDNEGADTPGKPAGRVGRAISGRPSDGTGRPGRVGRERGAMDACWRGRECIAAVASAAGMSGRAGIPGAVGIAGNVGIAGRAGQVGTTRPGAVGIATSSSPATSPTGDNEILAGAAAASNGTETPSDSDTAAAGTGRVGSTGNVGIAGKVGTRRPGTVGIDTSISPPTSPTGGTEILVEPRLPGTAPKHQVTAILRPPEQEGAGGLVESEERRQVRILRAAPAARCRGPREGEQRLQALVPKLGGRRLLGELPRESRRRATLGGQRWGLPEAESELQVRVARPGGWRLMGKRLRGSTPRAALGGRCWGLPEMEGIFVDRIHPGGWAMRRWGSLGWDRDGRWQRRKGQAR